MTNTNQSSNHTTEAREIISRPSYYGQKGRALVWYWRALAAYNLAAIIDGEEVTREEYEAARKLLDSCQRYALADAHQWERTNSSERYANSRYCADDEARLNRRREALQKRLARYGLAMHNYGLYPEIVKVDEESNKTHLYTRANGVALYYFD